MKRRESRVGGENERKMKMSWYAMQLAAVSWLKICSSGSFKMAFSGGLLRLAATEMRKLSSLTSKVARRNM